MKPIRIRLAAIAVGAATLVALPGVALAQTDETTDVAPDTVTDRAIDRSADTATDRATDRATDAARDHGVDVAKERALAAIDRRLATLDRLSELVASNPHVTSGHAAELQADYDAASRGLTELAGQIEAATSLEELRELIPKIAEDYRVYLVIVPKTHLVVVSDTMVAHGERFDEAVAKLQELIDRAAGAGWEVTEAQRLLDEADGLADEAVDLAAPVAGEVIGLTASDWPDPAQSMLESGRETLGEARSLFRSAGDTLHAAVEALRAANPTDAQTDF